MVGDLSAFALQKPAGRIRERGASVVCVANDVGGGEWEYELLTDEPNQIHLK